MKAQLILLAELQSVDTRLQGIEAARETIFAKQRELQIEVDKLRGELRTLTTKADELEKERREKDLELQTDRDKLRKWETRAEELKTGREFAALNREIEGLKRSNQEVHDRITAIRSELAELNQQASEVEGKLRGAEKALADEAAAVSDTLAEHDRNIARQREQRAKIATQIPASLVKKYQQILQRRGGVAVVMTKDSTCTGCNMGIPPQTFIRVMRGETFEQCPSCSRILYAEGLVQQTPAGAEVHT